MKSLEERFWAKVDKNGPDGCWLWTASRTDGYGKIFREGVLVYAHRVAWELVGGSIPEGMKIDHRCRVRACVNPDHLRVVTNKQNCEHLDADRGASFHRHKKRWRGYATHDGRQYSAGYFATREEALQAAATLRRRLFTHNDEDRA